MYVQTSKILTSTLSREERQIFFRCHSPKSLDDLRKSTGLDDGQLERALKNLVLSGLLKHVTNEAAPKTKTAFPKEDALTRAKKQFQRELERVLGARADKFSKDIQAAETLTEFEEVTRKLLLKLKLTISKEAAKELEASALELSILS
jgi:DNA-binding MarR family transcriptional regulator